MTSPNFQSIATDAVSFKDAPTTIILPGLVADALHSAKMAADADPEHLEQGGAIFATRARPLDVKKTIVIPQRNATQDAIVVDRTPIIGWDDHLLGEFHVHPRGSGELGREFEDFDPPSRFDFNELGRYPDRFFLVCAGNVTYGILKTKEYDVWYHSLRRGYDNSMGAAYARYKREARAKGKSSVRSSGSAALEVCKKYHLVFYVGTKTSLTRLDRIPREWEREGAAETTPTNMPHQGHTKAERGTR